MRALSVCNIPAGTSFAKELAKGIVQLTPDPLDRARALVMVPSQRAAQALRSAFLDVTKGQASLLPRMIPIGELADDVADIFPELDGDSDTASLPPAISPLRRQMMLAKLLGGFKLGDQAPTYPQTMMLADTLGQLLDQLYNVDAEPDQLRDMLPERYSAHWQGIIKLLTILVDSWPAILASENVMDGVDRRNRLIRARIKSWQDNPPENLVIIAGSTGSIIATRELIHCVSGLPNGHVVLPGLDSGAVPEWDAISQDSGHPQYQLAQLLHFMEIAPSDVQNWVTNPISQLETIARRDLMREVFRPAKTTATWRQLAQDRPDLGRDALKGLEVIQTHDRRSEAGLIAADLRETLEHSGQTAALITPDRHLAEAVIAELARWKITIDDSAGTSLLTHRAGAFLQLLVEAIQENFAPLALLGVLKHPTASGGMAQTEFRAKVIQIEKLVLRGQRPPPGLDGLAGAIGDKKDLGDFVATHIAAPFAPLLHAWQAPTPTMASLARGLGQTAEMMAAQNMCLQADGQDGEKRVADMADGAIHLWDKQGGKAAADLLKNLVEYGHDQAVNASDFAQTFVQIMQDITVHAAQQSHPRLAILGAVESRMQTADHLIIAGFNEGNWPPQPHSDPWMNSDMRKAVGLPPHNWRTSLSAHDVYMAICNPKVTITRATRQNDAATIPSRWLQRMDVVLSALKITNVLNRGDTKFQWLDILNPKTLPNRIKRPAPKPPVSSRPRKFSATEIDIWINDPYALYAKKVLQLRQLDDVDRPPDAALRGTLFHNVLADFTRTFPSGSLPDDAYDKLLAIGKAHFADQWARPDVRYFWWPRFEMIAGWFIETEKQRRDALDYIHAEKKGSTILTGLAGRVELTARADRLEKTKDGTWHIIDYKTGVAPSKRKVADGRATQLLIEALIAWDGGYDNKPGCDIAKMQYWKLSGRKSKIGDINDVLPDNVTPENTRAMMQALITLYDNPETAYPAEPNVKYKLPYNPYRHLARILEWQQEGSDE